MGIPADRNPSFPLPLHPLARCGGASQRLSGEPAIAGVSHARSYPEMMHAGDLGPSPVIRDLYLPTHALARLQERPWMDWRRKEWFRTPCR